MKDHSIVDDVCGYDKGGKCSLTRADHLRINGEREVLNHTFVEPTLNGDTAEILCYCPDKMQRGEVREFIRQELASRAAAVDALLTDNERLRSLNNQLIDHWPLDVIPAEVFSEIRASGSALTMKQVLSELLILSDKCAERCPPLGTDSWHPADDIGKLIARIKRDV